MIILRIFLSILIFCYIFGLRKKRSELGITDLSTNIKATMDIVRVYKGFLKLTHLF